MEFNHGILYGNRIEAVNIYTKDVKESYYGSSRSGIETQDINSRY